MVQPAARGQRGRSARADAAERAHHARRGGVPRGQHRRHRVRLGARVADGADAAADARRQAVRLRAGRGLLAPLPVPEPGHAAARRGRPGERPAAARRAAGRPHRACWWRAKARTRRCCSCSCRRRRRSTAAPAGFSHKGDFPNTRNTDRCRSPRGGALLPRRPPFLQRYLPFWLANLVDRMWVVLVSIIAVLIPLSRIVPPLYQFRIRSRVFRWYGQLRAVEDAAGPAPERRAAAGARRDRARGRAGARAAVVRRRAVLAAQPHRDGARAPRHAPQAALIRQRGQG